MPDRESIREAHALLRGLVNLRPDRIAKLLRASNSVKSKRLFLALSARIGHAWFKHIDLKDIALGAGDAPTVCAWLAGKNERNAAAKAFDDTIKKEI